MWDWGFVNKPLAVISDSSHCSLDERVGMVIGCSDLYLPVSQGTESRLELCLQTGDLNSTFNKCSFSLSRHFDT